IANAADRSNVTVVDWYSQAVNNPQYFGKDGVHLTKSGSKAYVTLLTNTMKK
ncbi:hypothetical protein, partial [Listeria ivanovii]